MDVIRGDSHGFTGVQARRCANRRAFRKFAQVRRLPGDFQMSQIVPPVSVRHAMSRRLSHLVPACPTRARRRFLSLYHWNFAMTSSASCRSFCTFLRLQQPTSGQRTRHAVNARTLPLMWGVCRGTEERRLWWGVSAAFQLTGRRWGSRGSCTARPGARTPGTAGTASRGARTSPAGRSPCPGTAGRCPPRAACSGRRGRRPRPRCRPGRRGTRCTAPAPAPGRRGD